MTDFTLLDPKNDLVFKKLFVPSPDLLSDLINAMRWDASPIEVVEILNPRIDPEDLTGKFIVLDVLAKDRQGHLFNIEMQVRPYHTWSIRSLYYLAKLLAQQLQSGEEYGRLQPVIGIHLLNFELFPAPEQAVWCFELRDRLQPTVCLGKELQLNLIELPKAERLRKGPEGFMAWIDYFEHWQEEARMNQINYPPVQRALEQLQVLSQDAEARQMAEARERALRDEISELSAAWQRGLKEGREEGREQGREEGREQGREEGREQGREEGVRETTRTLARRLLARGLAVDEVAELSGLSRDEVSQLSH